MVRCLTGHLGNPVPSPALFSQLGNRFVRDVKAFARANRVPILRLNKPDRSRWDDRKVDHVRPYVDAAEAAGRFGVVAIVSTQEFQWVFSGRNRSTTPWVVSFDFTRSSHRVGTYYFCVLDAELGLGFIKICTYFPYPAKVWVNGHEWAKRQADRYFAWMDAWIKRRVEIPDVVATALTRRGLLFVGHRLDDWDFRFLFHGIKTFEAKGQLRRNFHVGVQLDPQIQMTEPDAAQDYLEKLLGEDRVSVYWGSVEQFMDEFVRARGSDRS